LGSLGGTVGYGVTVWVAVGPTVVAVADKIVALVGVKLGATALPVGDGVGVEVVLFCVPAAASTAESAFINPLFVPAGIEWLAVVSMIFFTCSLVKLGLAAQTKAATAAT